MKIFKAEQWNLELLLPLFEQYRLSQGMVENPERTLIFLTNRIRFSESIFFLAVDEQNQALGFIQLYPRLSSLQLQRYWQLTDIFVQQHANSSKIYTALIAKATEFVRYTQATRLIVEQRSQQHNLLEMAGFKVNPDKQIFELRL
ncbi:MULTISPECIES: GNAT family N-acetyltransferase [unclassified Avibacterium]|uniref:GNAT family N-acetyltransferase n=1 Tax=unclassified Avibacterium TaxID=2685287 RepID=UPI0020262341|nr:MULTISPECIES: GNAT family N-acetyltransferase [unclassified Avibacterium]URL01977.1 GNAT family N-acetyltransferase [Avibacterium sp. 20-126]MCW9699136.1 GNAT family N-acetyltransferase [Avibacterium sp. 20-129]MCW9718808.1 GNAT family N-acetyltransferase [Avibacterium sp. 21-599]MCW9732993.1 GNAT family N-acetyltransferase [Avibacterium sp. 20-15]URL05123.1 GNAT family N-acetyltransferase [Avibacterium sp. 20-132]